MAAKDELGRRGEELAVEHLVETGYTILDRNWRHARGELDVVAQQDGTVVVVEVKTRSGSAYGHPLEAITVTKRARLRALTAAWLAAHPAPSEPRGVRVDAIAIVARRGEDPVLEQVEGIA